jgi:hypothetical protein
MIAVIKNDIANINATATIFTKVASSAVRREPFIAILVYSAVEAAQDGTVRERDPA